MFRYADPLACPRCRAPLAAHATACPACSVRLDTPAAYDVFRGLQQVDRLVARLYDVEPTLPARATPGASAAEPALTTAGPTPGPTAPGAGSPVSLPAFPAGRFAPTSGQHGFSLSASAVPRILLGLGALCLLVAALVFLAVAWAALGVGGRTVVLVTFTAIAAGLAGWSARRGLRAGSEAFAAVALGLLALDIAGARTAGWLGDIDDGGFAVLIGLLVGGAAIAGAVAVRDTREPRLVSAEIAAALGLASVLGGIGLLGEDAGPAVWATAAIVIAGGTAAALHRLGLPFAAAGSLAQAALAWVLLGLVGLDRIVDDPSVAALWGHLAIWPALLAAALPLGLLAVPRVDPAWQVLAASVSSLGLTVAAVAPVLDETGRIPALTAIGVVLVHALLARALSGRWTWVTAAPSAIAGTGLTLGSAFLGLAALDTLLDHGVWTRHATSVLAPPRELEPWAVMLPAMVAAACLAGATLARCVGQAIRPLAPAAAATLAVGVLLAPVLLGPTVLVASVLLLVASAAIAGAALRLQSPFTALVAFAVYAVGLGTALADDGCTVALLAAGTAASVALELRGPRPLREPAQAATVVLGVALAWSVSTMAGVPLEWRALPIAVALGGVVLARPTLTREVASVVLAAIVVVASVTTDQGFDESWSAIYLTVGGVIATIAALIRPERRHAAWLGLALLTAAQWIRLHQIGVGTVEAYTLPLAAVLLVVGVWSMRTTDRSSDVLMPGLGLALVPTLLQVVVDPIGIRALLLGLACVACVLGGVMLRWSSPLVAGAAVGACVVVRQAAEAEMPPQWVVIGTVGAILAFTGLTWERRLADLHRAGDYLRALR